MNVTAQMGKPCFAIAIYLDNGYKYASPAGVVFGLEAKARVRAMAQAAGGTIASKAVDMSPSSGFDLLEGMCRMTNLPRAFLDPEKELPLCLRPGFDPYEYSAHRTPPDQSWVEESSWTYAEVRPPRESSRTVAVFGARPADLYPGRDDSSKVKRYQRKEYQKMLVDIKRELRHFADEGTTIVVTDETQGAAQLGHWAAEALKREDYDMYNDVYVTFDGCENSWKEGIACFSRNDFANERNCADELHFMHEPPTDGPNLPRDVYKQVCQQKHRTMAAISEAGICATIYGTARVPALPGVPLDFEAIKQGLTAAGRQDIYSLDDLAAARAGASAKIESANAKVQDVARDLTVAKTKLDTFEQLAEQSRAGGDDASYIKGCIETTRASVIALESKHAAAQEELKAAKGSFGDFDKIEAAARCCDMDAAMASLGSKAASRKTMAAYGEKAQVPRTVQAVKAAGNPTCGSESYGSAPRDNAGAR